MKARKAASDSRDVTKIMQEIVSRIPSGLTVTVTDYSGREEEILEPEVRYAFGNSLDIKAGLDELSRSGEDEGKLPLVALFTPIVEERGKGEWCTTVKVNMLIACRTSRDWTNAERRERSFADILRPVYRRLMDELGADPRLDFGYEGKIPHSYSENYSYGRYGAYTAAGDEVSEPIDAIDIRNLELKVTHQTCR